MEGSSSGQVKENIVLALNAGGVNDSVSYSGITFEQDKFYTSGNSIITDVEAMDGKVPALYQSARYGDFSYNFPYLDDGEYFIDLHFAEIEFTNGPRGMRVFDVYIQDEKAISGIDIYAEVGPNNPLTIHNLKASVVEREGLSIEFEGLVGKPLVCGISIRRGFPADSRGRKVLGARAEFITDSVAPVRRREQHLSPSRLKSEMKKRPRDVREAGPHVGNEEDEQNSG